MGLRRKRGRSRLKSHSTIHKCPQLLAEPQIHFPKWPKLLQLIFTVKCRERSKELPRSRKQFPHKGTPAQKQTPAQEDISSLQNKKKSQEAKNAQKNIQGAENNSHTREQQHRRTSHHWPPGVGFPLPLDSFELDDSISQLPPLH